MQTDSVLRLFAAVVMSKRLNVNWQTIFNICCHRPFSNFGSSPRLYCVPKGIMPNALIVREVKGYISEVKGYLITNALPHSMSGQSSQHAASFVSARITSLKESASDERRSAPPLLGRSDVYHTVTDGGFRRGRCERAAEDRAI